MPSHSPSAYGLGESSHFLDYLSARYLNKQTEIIVNGETVSAWAYGNTTYVISPSGRLDVYQSTGPALCQTGMDYISLANDTF